MDGDQIRMIISKDRCLREHFRGIFARDQVPRCLLPGFYFWNNGLYSSSGEHWLATYVTNDYTVEFFDSFGNSPQFYGWNIIGDVMYNKKSLQAPDSDICGMYCIFFMHFRSRGYSLQTILDNFSENSIQNDEYIQEFMKVLK